MISVPEGQAQAQAQARWPSQPAPHTPTKCVSSEDPKRASVILTKPRSASGTRHLPQADGEPGSGS